MARVQFYHNTPDPLALACELTARAYAGGRRVALRAGDPATAIELDKLLWTFDQFAFIPHVDVDSPLAEETPVLIGRADSTPHWPHADLLFNLAADVPAAFDAFRTVVEIISQKEHDKAPARARWMHYKQHGAQLQAFDSVLRERI